MSTGPKLPRFVKVNKVSHLATGEISYVRSWH